MNDCVKLSIGDVERLTGIRQHILRYWEDNIPLLNPEKDEYGRRVYTQDDLDLVFRLKYLINEKKFTVEGASQELFKESQSEKENKTAFKIQQIRRELLQMYTIVNKGTQ